MSWQILQGDCLDVLRGMESESVQCCVTSPPYWGLRDYGVDGQLGLERTPEEYVARMVEVFREVRRVLRNDGVLWMNLGDSYASGGRGSSDAHRQKIGDNTAAAQALGRKVAPEGLKDKDLVGIPWLTAFALRTDGWYLRSDVIWSKPNAMPESVTDRPTKAHEYIFLFSKSRHYFYDCEAIREMAVTSDDKSHHSFGTPGGKTENTPGKTRKESGKKWNPSMAGGAIGIEDRKHLPYILRNKRTVWEVPTNPYSEAHFATFPPDLIEPCIKAGSREGDTVLDPFNGAGTTGLVATRFNRNYIGIELNPEYVAMSRRRIEQDAPLFNLAAATDNQTTQEPMEMSRGRGE